MANVKDFRCDIFPQDLMQSIIDHQHRLADKYIPIEKSNGLCLYDQLPGDIDNAKAQARIKDMSWRAVEEVAEAYEAYEEGNELHLLEELADALHFLAEKYLICGFKPALTLQDYFHMAKSADHGDRLDSYVGQFTVACGLTCNCLKNKPWKQSQMLTDVNKFNTLLEVEFGEFIVLCHKAGFETAEDLYSMYVRKNQVNQFRQRSNY